MAEVPHTDFVDLFRYPAKSILVHHGTREAVEVDGPVTALRFSDEGFAWLDKGGRDLNSVWVNDLLTRSVHVDGDDESSRFVHNRTDGGSCFLDQQKRSYTCHAIALEVAAAEVYIYGVTPFSHERPSFVLVVSAGRRRLGHRRVALGEEEHRRLAGLVGPLRVLLRACSAVDEVFLGQGADAGRFC